MWSGIHPERPKRRKVLTPILVRVEGMRTPGFKRPSRMPAAQLCVDPAQKFRLPERELSESWGMSSLAMVLAGALEFLAKVDQFVVALWICSVVHIKPSVYSRR